MAESSIIKRAAQVVILAALAAITVRIFLLDSFIVKGESMAPTIMDGDYVFIDKRAYISSEPLRGDIVVGEFRDLDVRAIKRVIAVPPEWITVAPDIVYVQLGREGATTAVDDSTYVSLAGYGSNGATTTYRLDPFEYFVLGDNRALSEDSRSFGPVDKVALQGRVVARFRFSDFSFVTY